MGDSAEAIAKVCADLKAERITNIFGMDYSKSMMEWIRNSEIVDATRIYHDLTDRQKGIDVYKEHVMCPVWKSALVGYVNQHSNVTVMHSFCADYGNGEVPIALIGQPPGQERMWESLSGTHEIDWPKVQWVYNITVWLGGRSNSTGVIPTAGPLHLWRIAVYPDGTMADINWVNLDPKARDDPERWDPDQWDMANLVVLGAINLGNCVNVELREPTRQRAVARRIARTGVRVNEIHVKPISTSYRGRKGDSDTTSSVALHSVRGHFAHYGPKYDRQLLFGKYEGRYWIPQAARGSAEVGKIEHQYVMES